MSQGGLCASCSTLHSLALELFYHGDLATSIAHEQTWCSHPVQSSPTAAAKTHARPRKPPCIIACSPLSGIAQCTTPRNALGGSVRISAGTQERYWELDKRASAVGSVTRTLSRESVRSRRRRARTSDGHPDSDFILRVCWPAGASAGVHLPSSFRCSQWHAPQRRPANSGGQPARAAGLAWLAARASSVAHLGRRARESPPGGCSGIGVSLLLCRRRCHRLAVRRPPAL